MGRNLPCHLSEQNLCRLYQPTHENLHNHRQQTNSLHQVGECVIVSSLTTASQKSPRTTTRSTHTCRPLNRLYFQYSTDSIIDTLLPYVSERRQQRIETTLSYRLDSIQLALELPYNIKNAFTILRTCECLGIQHLHIINPTD